MFFRDGSSVQPELDAYSLNYSAAGMIPGLGVASSKNSTLLNRKPAIVTVTAWILQPTQWSPSCEPSNQRASQPPCHKIDGGPNQSYSRQCDDSEGRAARWSEQEFADLA